MVYLTFIALIFVAAFAGLVVNNHLDHVWEAHWRWLEGQPAAP